MRGTLVLGEARGFGRSDGAKKTAGNHNRIRRIITRQISWTSGPNAGGEGGGMSTASDVLKIDVRGDFPSLRVNLFRGKQDIGLGGARGETWR